MVRLWKCHAGAQECSCVLYRETSKCGPCDCQSDQERIAPSPFRSKIQAPFVGPPQDDFQSPDQVAYANFMQCCAKYDIMMYLRAKRQVPKLSAIDSELTADLEKAKEVSAKKLEKKETSSLDIDGIPDNIRLDRHQRWYSYGALWHIFPSHGRTPEEQSRSEEPRLWLSSSRPV